MIVGGRPSSRSTTCLPVREILSDAPSRSARVGSSLLPDDQLCAPTFRSVEIAAARNSPPQ